MCNRQLEYLDPITAFKRDVAVAKHDHLAATCADLMQVRAQLFEQVVAGGRYDHRQIFVDQRQRTMLELASGIALGMNVGHFLELQCTFQRDRKLRATAEEQRVRLVGNSRGQRLDFPVQRQHFACLLRDLTECRGDFAQSGRLGSVFARQRRAQQQKNGQLGGEGLGRGDANFQSGAGHQAVVADLGQRTFRHVADSETSQVVPLFGQLESRQRIGGLAGLRDGQHQRAIGHCRGPVTVLAGNLDHHRNPGQGLDPVTRHHAGVVTGAASQDMDRPGVA